MAINETQQNTPAQSLVSTLSSFAGYSYLYGQLDNVFDGIANSTVYDNKTFIKLPLSETYSSEQLHEFGNDVMRFTTNASKSLDNSSSVSNIVRHIERGETGLLDALRKSDLDSTEIEDIIKNGSKKLNNNGNMVQRSMRKISAKSRRTFDYNSGLVKKIAEIEKAGGDNVYKDAAELFAKKYGAKDKEAVEGIFKHLTTTVKNNQLTPQDLKGGGVGLLVDFNKIIPKGVLGTGLRVGAGIASWAIHPFTQLAVIPALKAAKSVIDSKKNEAVTEYVGQIDEYEFSDLSRETMVTQNVNMQTISQEKQMLQLSFSNGREVNKFMDSALRQNYISPEPLQYRKRHRN